MRRTAVAVRLAALIALLMATQTEAQEGRTIWGDDYASTVKAMKDVAKALGVKSCLHCHVKEGGKIAYEVETPNKQIARQMKAAFVDSLASRGQAQIELSSSERKTRISAVYTAKGKDAGIQLTVTLPPSAAEAEPRSFQTRVELPKEGGLHCETCHAGKLHFVTGE